MGIESLSVESFSAELAQKMLDKDALKIANDVNDIKGALRQYISNPHGGLLMYLKQDEDFAQALYDILVNDVSPEALDMILEYVIRNKPEQKQLSLQDIVFRDAGGFFTYYLNSPIVLLRKELSDILSQWPDEEDENSEKKYCLGVSQYLDITNKSLVLECEMINATIKTKGTKDIIECVLEEKDIFDISRNDQNIIIKTLQFYHEEKSLFEIFGVDPIAVLASRK